MRLLWSSYLGWGLSVGSALCKVWGKVMWYRWMSHTPAGCQPPVHRVTGTKLVSLWPSLSLLPHLCPSSCGNSLRNLSFQPQHSRLVAFSHPFPAVYPSTVALPEVNLWTANSEFFIYTFSPDRYRSKCSASFYPEPKTMAPPVALKACGSVWTTHLL